MIELLVGAVLGLLIGGIAGYHWRDCREPRDYVP